MKRSPSIPVLALLVALAGCGDDDGQPATRTPTPTASTAVTRTPTPTNLPPQMVPIGDRTATLGSDLLIPVSATDPEGQAVTLSARDLPPGSYFLPESGVLCIFPTAEQVGSTFNVLLRAGDTALAFSEQAVAITIVGPGGSRSGGAVSVTNPITMAPIGDHALRVGEPFRLRLTAEGGSPLAFRMFPSPAIAALATLDPASGEFRFTPTAAQAGQTYEVTFQACVPSGSDCDATAQQHETVHLSVYTAGACPDFVPATCTELGPSDQLPQPVTSCFVIRVGGAAPYIHDNVNILAGGALYFVEDPGQTVDFQVASLLVEQSGVLQAGSATCPYGAQGGRLSIALYGGDPSNQGTTPNPPPGIQCLTNAADAMASCFPAGRDPARGPFYCAVGDSNDPCSAETRPPTDPDNYLLEHYGNLNFDPTPWGYKVLGVSYGGTLRLFGWKGAKPLQDPAWAASYDSTEHCVAPTAAQSTLDAAEMQAWANLTGSAWARLDASAAAAGATTLTLDRLVSDWAVGDDIVVGTTDWYPSHSERRTITAVASVSTPGGMRTQLTVDALAWPHASDMFDADALATDHGATYTKPTNRTAADLRATVALLSRSIEIRSLGAQPQPSSAAAGFPPPAQCVWTNGALPDQSCYFGGHTMVRQGFREAQMQGVGFTQLGQGGRMGHYATHFHLAKNTAYTGGKAYLKDSAVTDSMTRFATLHGTHEVTLARNVGYLSVGHGFYIEDGSEIENLLCHNVGISARAALQEYYAAQAQPASWPGGVAPATARAVPGILDGVSANNTLAAAPALVAGSDTYMPVTFWMMNAYNELVGNHAVGVHGFGSCYWLLGSGVSGPSAQAHEFDGFAAYNVAGNYQAPLLRFRGNSCTTATYALPASAELSPAAPGEALNTGYTPVLNPYTHNADGSFKSLAALAGQYARPAVVGNFQPIEPNSAGATGCASVGVGSDAALQPNVDACVTTVIDRFTTSFNWAQVNYGSIWLRPWFYLFLNSAVTDQLFGGLTFVTSGSWLQVPPGYFSLAKDSLFVGSTQHGGSQWAQRSGPRFSVAAGDNLAQYAPCAKRGFTTCNLESEGIGLWTGGFQPKRLINIYDGPHFADGNLFLNVGSWECDPQPCLGKQPGQCSTDLPCGIYSSTIQPAPNVPGQTIDPHRMIVLDAAVGWKQPNGFYYPPAFTYRSSTYFKDLPTGLPDPDPANPLNQCFASGAANGFGEPTELPGDCRHNVIDRTRDYIAGNMLALNGGPATYPAALNILPTTPIDFSTILLDLDGSLTGAAGMVSGVDLPVPTASLSRNPFFDAPAQSPECLSFGVQTSPYGLVTTLIAPTAAAPAAGDTWIEPWTYIASDGKVTPASSIAAIYRQWETATDPATCGQVCSESAPTTYGCTRGSFMVGPNVGQAPYLTLSQPPGLSGQGGTLYFIDTSTAAKQPLGCINARTQAMQPATFAANGNYVLYNLFARNDSAVSYQLPVGDGINDLAALQGRYVRVNPHVTSTENANSLSSFRSVVTDACDPSSGSGWCAGLPKPTVTNGVLTVTLDQRPIAADYETVGRADYDRCMPRDTCYFDGTQCQPCAGDTSNPKCIRQADFLPGDIASLQQPDASGRKPLDVICQDWASYASGTTAPTVGELSLVDCPDGGCLGFAFTLPSTFVGDKIYAELGGTLAQCFSRDAWSSDALVERMTNGQPADPLCGAPRASMSGDFCAP